MINVLERTQKPSRLESIKELMIRHLDVDDSNNIASGIGLLSTSSILYAISIPSPFLFYLGMFGLGATSYLFKRIDEHYQE